MFKVVVYHACNLDLSIHVYIDVLNYGCGSINHTCGVLVSSCTHTHVRLLFMCMLIYQTMVERTLILRQSSTNGCLVWLLKFIHVKVVLK